MIERDVLGRRMNKYMHKNLLALLSGLFIALLFACSLSLSAHFVPRERVFENVKVSIPVISKFRRADTFTECMVMASAILPDNDIAHSVFDFKTLGNRPNDRTIPHDHETCAGLRALLNGESAEQIGTGSYTRYWNGPVSLARFALFLTPFLPAYIMYAVISFGAFALWGWSLAYNGVKPRTAGLIAFASFYGSGLPYVAGNLAHTPAYTIPILLVTIASIKSSWWQSMQQSVALAALVGGVTFYFDMLFMAIPYNAIFFGVTWLLLSLVKPGVANKPLWPKLAGLLVTYGISGAVMLGFKLVMIGLLSNPDAVFRDFFKQLLWRMSNADHKGQTFSYFDVVAINLPKAATKMFFHPFIYYVLFTTGLYAFFQAVRRDKYLATAFALLAFIPPIWCAIFTNHSWIHGTFAMRILFWPPLLGVLAWHFSHKHSLHNAVSSTR